MAALLAHSFTTCQTTASLRLIPRSYLRGKRTGRCGLRSHGGHEPGIDCVLDPVWNGHRPDMPCLADQVDDGPVIVPLLKMGKIQFCRLFPAQPAAQEHPEQRSISLAFERTRVRHLPERPCLVGGEPVSETNTEVLRPFNSPDASSKIRGE